MSTLPPVQTVERAAPPAVSLTAARRSPAHHLHQALGVRFTSEAGWELPAAYGDVEAERETIRSGLAIADISGRGKVDLRGPDGHPLLAGTAVYKDAIVARISSQWALLLTPPGGEGECLRVAEANAGPSGMVTDATSMFAGFAVLGPRTDELLSRLSPVDPRSVRPGTAAALQLAKVPTILVRTDRAAEAYVPSEYGRYVWEALLTAGHRLDVRAVGWEALRGEGWC